MSNILDDALALAELGIPVFPLRLTDKRPVVAGGFKSASTDPAEVARMFADPAAGLIGVPCGPASGFDAIDVDVKRGGLEWLAANEHRLPPTRRHHTRSAGVHLLLQHSPGMRTKFDRIAPGVEVRGEGGYIVWWPAHGFAVSGSAWAAWPDWLLILALHGMRDPNAAPPAPEELAPPSAADLVALLNATPNPEVVTRGEYTALNLSVQGCLRALDALGKLDADAADDIRTAAAEWCARWDSERAADAETELARWESDWSTRTNDISGWRHILNFAARCGADISQWTLAAAQAEFGALPDEPEPVSAGPTAPAVSPGSAVRAPDPAWESKLTTGREGPHSSLANVLYILRRAPEWCGVFRYDSFANQIVVCRAPPYQGGAPAPRALADTDYTRVAVWMQDRGLKDVSPSRCFEAIAAAADDDKFSPLQDYLNGLQHDGAARIDTWLIDFLGVADTPLHRAFSAKFLISAVARAFEPGAKVDTMLVLEGRQGLMKSTALQTLFGSERFTDHVPDLGSKDAMLQLQGVWCIEHAEMATLNRADANRIKEFITRRHDRFRAPYGKVTANFPRQCVFAGTLNPTGTGYLRDETGARRFWPVKCGATWNDGRRVDIPALTDARDQLWAEAVARYRLRESWWLEDADAEAAQAEAAEARYDADPWTDAVSEAISDRPFVRVGDVFAALNIQLPDRTKAAQMRIGGILRKLGWERKLQRVDGSPARLYVPSVPPAPRSQRDDIAALVR